MSGIVLEWDGLFRVVFLLDCRRGMDGFVGLYVWGEGGVRLLWRGRALIRWDIW